MLAFLQHGGYQLPHWLEFWRALLAAGASAAVIVGVIAAAYRFRREKPHEGRLQPTVSGTFERRDGTIYLVAAMSAQNAGQVSVSLNLADTALDVYTRSAGDADWTHFDVFSVFTERGQVRPDETIEDKLWIEIPEDNRIGVKLELSIVGRDDKRTLWPGIEIVSLLANEGGNPSEDG